MSKLAEKYLDESLASLTKAAQIPNLAYLEKKRLAKIRKLLAYITATGPLFDDIGGIPGALNMEADWTAARAQVTHDVKEDEIAHKKYLKASRKKAQKEPKKKVKKVA